MIKSDFNKMLSSLYSTVENKMYPIILLKQLADIAYVFLDVKIMTFGYFNFATEFNEN